MKDSRDVGGAGGSWVRRGPGLEAALGATGIRSAAELSARGTGLMVTDHRTSWVRRVEAATTTLYIKTYDYPTWRDRLRGAGRTTWLARSRAAREWDGLAWLRRHGFSAPEPHGALEVRRHGVLRRAVLVTAGWDGEPLDRLLPALVPPQRDALLLAVERLVTALHAAGWRDRNLDLRNLLARRGDRGGWEVAKIDSPRHRIVRADRGSDRAAQQDWERLARSLAAEVPASNPPRRPRARRR